METNQSQSNTKTAEILGIVCLFFCLFCLGSLISLTAFISQGELMGPLGQKWASWMVYSVGLISWGVPLLFLVFSFRLFGSKPILKASDLYVGLLVFTVFFLIYSIGNWLDIHSFYGNLGIGLTGLWGQFIFGLTSQLLGVVGLSLLMVAFFLMALLGLFSHQIKQIINGYVGQKSKSEPPITDNKKEKNVRPEPQRTDAEKNTATKTKLDSTNADEFPKINDAHHKENTFSAEKMQKLHLEGHKAYEYPSLDILVFEPPKSMEIDKDAMYELAQRLEKTLLDYQVRGKVIQIHPGPVVTMYEFVPDAGVRLSKITTLANDLAMALEALRVRIVAPIPGKAAVGIEVPNKYRQTVYLKEVLSHESFVSAKSKLTLALGKDIAGRPTSVDLAKMPHLLVAGTTGSGKSVAVNVMIASILFHTSPEEVKLLMIDPKMLELSIYEGIPHLLLPVITEPKKANLALRWVVDEMERRYALIAKSALRDINSYNRQVEILQNSGEQIPEKPGPIRIIVHDQLGHPTEKEVEASIEAVIAAGGIVTDDVREDIIEAEAVYKAALSQKEERDSLEKLPYIVVVIDEFADLMMIAAKEVETSVARIAQKARAAGIHLVLATQRPSVDVITGLIKANFPSRIAFQVASRIDSRTILDAQGAETLLGMGDMLLMDRGQALFRVHGALVTDQEIQRLVQHLKKQGEPIYNLDILAPRDHDEKGEDTSFEDEMYELAVAVVKETRQASISLVQRKLRIGYNRAARLIEQMEKEGIVSAPDGAKGREVLIPF